MSTEERLTKVENDLKPIKEYFETVHAPWPGSRYTPTTPTEPVPPVPTPTPDDGKPAAPKTMEKIPVIVVDAQSFQKPNEPLNVMKKYDPADKERRWSAEGRGTWIEFNFGKYWDVAGLDISFYKSGERSTSFDVMDGNLHNIGSFASSGDQTDFERFTLAKPVKTSKLKLVFKSNTENNWFSLRSVSVFGKKSVNQTPPEPSPPIPTPTPTPTDGIIEDGIKMFYPKIGATQTFVFKSGNKGRSQYVCILKKPLINLEVTGILDLKEVDNKGEEVSVKTRGGPHNKDDPDAGCCYISGVKYAGTVNNQYECPHPHNHPMSLHEKQGKFNPGSVVGKKFGIKNIVYYDKAQDKDVIKLYLDMQLNNNWQLFFETTSTQFKNKENSNGKPMVFFRMDDIPGAPDSDENAKLTKGTVREIEVKN